MISFLSHKSIGFPVMTRNVVKSRGHVNGWVFKLKVLVDRLTRTASDICVTSNEKSSVAPSPHHLPLLVVTGLFERFKVSQAVVLLLSLQIVLAGISLFARAVV